MQNLSTLLINNNKLIQPLVNTLYDRFEIIFNDKGEEQLIFIRYYQGRKLFFDEKGIMYLYRAAIAFFLKTNSSNVNRTIQRIEQMGFLDHHPMGKVKWNIPIDGFNADGPVEFYSSYVINLVASRLTKPSKAALEFLHFRENALALHQQYLTEAMANAYVKGHEDASKLFNPQIEQLTEENTNLRQSLAVPQGAEDPISLLHLIQATYDKVTALETQQKQELTKRRLEEQKLHRQRRKKSISRPF